MKKNIGYTTGVFDMFHVGHLNILKEAKDNCDHLVVGVSVDELVASYKNKTPIVPYSDRAKIIESIKYVDEVIPVTTRDKIAQFENIKYNILFVGDDWKDSDIFNSLEKYLHKFDCSIKYIPYTQKVSSSKFRSLLQKIYDEGI